jgi:AcrR family transcriptional regulator
MTLRNVISIGSQVAFMIRLPTSLPPDRPTKPFVFACGEVLLNRISPITRKRSASTRPSTGNRRNPVLHQAIIDAATEVVAKEGPTRFTIEAVAKSAGCGKPTIYRWWPSRPALLLEVYDQLVQQELAEPEGNDLAKDLAAMLRLVWQLWRKDTFSSLYRLILSEMILEEEGARYLRQVFVPRRQAFAASAFQAAKDRGEIPPETDVKLLMDLMYGYSIFRLITRQIDDEQISDRIGALIAMIARSGISNSVRTEQGRRSKKVARASQNEHS